MRGNAGNWFEERVTQAWPHAHLRVFLCSLVAAWIASAWVGVADAQTLADVVRRVEPSMVKIYGAGGLRGLEAYQSGFVISADGLVLTAWTYVLDTDEVTVTLSDGRRFVGQLLGADPRLEIALLKIDAVDLPHFDLSQSASLTTGDRVLAFSNLYGVAVGNEPTSVQHGVVAAVAPLVARRGPNRVPYEGEVYVLDAMTNNAGAAGGALTNVHGELAGLLGREVRDARSNVWLNYALPIRVLTDSIEKIRSGELIPRLSDDELVPVDDPWTLTAIGLQLVPDLLHKTPPYIDTVLTDSAAAEAGVAPDDLVLYVNERLVRSVSELKRELSLISRETAVTLTVQREADLKIFTFEPR